MELGIASVVAIVNCRDDQLVSYLVYWQCYRGYFEEQTGSAFGKFPIIERRMFISDHYRLFYSFVIQGLPGCFIGGPLKI